MSGPLQPLLDLPGVQFQEESIQGTTIATATLRVPSNVVFASLPGVPELHAFLRDLRARSEDAGLTDPKWLAAVKAVLARRPELLEPLRPYQRQAVLWLLGRPYGILGDDMGLGKTLTTIRAAEIAVEVCASPEAAGCWWEQRQPHVLLLAPKTLRGEWKQQLRQWSAHAPTREGETFFACEGTRPEAAKIQAKHRWVFCHYDILQHWARYLSPLHPIATIADEAHALKGTRTRRRDAAEFAFGIGWFGWLLTGTPILNRLTELHSLYHLPSPWGFGSGSAFRRHYLGAQEGAFGLEDGEIRNEGELQARVATCYLARKKRDVGLQLPSLTRQLREVELDDNAYADLDGVLSGLPARSLFEALLRGAGGPQTAKLITRAKQILAAAKVPASVGAALDALESDQSVLVFSGFRAPCNRIAKGIEKAGWETSFVTGALTQPQREKEIEAFRAPGGRPRALVATYATLAVGANLQAASVGVFNDLPWTPAELLQAEARFYRGGQGRACTSVWQVGRRTIDDMLIACLSRKGSLISDALGDTDAQTLMDFLSEDESVLVEDVIRRWEARRHRDVGGFAPCP